MTSKKKLFSVVVIFSVIASLTVFLLEIKQKKKSERPYITIVGPIEMADGIGRQTAELANMFLEDFKVNIISSHVIKTDVPKPVINLLKNVSKNRTAKLGKIVIWEESLWSPGADIGSVFEKISKDNEIRIAYSMLESTRIPQEWVMQLNLYYDAVAVPDVFLVDVYKKSGVKIPVFVVPLGIDISGFLNKPLKKERNPVMLFGNLGSALDRKNQIMLIKAFARVLGNVKDAALYINCRNGTEIVRQEIIDEIASLGCSNIYFTELKLRNDAYLEVFQNLDCYVSLSKGEGFSIQPREAMALGIPVIATNNTGQTTICNSNLVKVIASDILEPAMYCGKELSSGYQFNCEIDDVAAALMDMYTNYDQHVKRAPLARNWASSYDYSNKELSKIYRSLVNPKEIIFGTENKIHEDYIMTDSKDLYEKYKKLAIFRK